MPDASPQARFRPWRAADYDPRTPPIVPSVSSRGNRIAWPKGDNAQVIERGAVVPSGKIDLVVGFALQRRGVVPGEERCAALVRRIERRLVLPGRIREAELRAMIRDRSCDRDVDPPITVSPTN